MINIVHVLSHTREFPEGVDVGRCIGVYDTREKAEAAKLMVANLPGFSDHAEGFHICAYRLNEDHWTSGFFIYQPPE